MVCVLFVIGLPTQGATASGTTAFTCKSGSGAGFSDAHCKTAVGSGASFRHESIAQDSSTELTSSNETTGGASESTKLKATLAGTSFTFTATTATGSGSMTNGKEGEEHFAHGEGSITYTGVTSTGGCKVFTDSGAGKGEEGVIHTEPLKASTKGQGDALKFEPASGTVFARFLLEGCTNTGINGTYTVTGSIKTTSIEGTTGSVTHADTTTQNTLKLNGTIKAGLEGTLTFKGRANSGQSYSPLGATTGFA
ncbi:MAG TPA: hypothetical protein VFX45_01105 [Solirubrobacterales bacterium]|nr:hypothetical protein [Solirubrobacterales bacterium]